MTRRLLLFFGLWCVGAEVTLWSRPEPSLAVLVGLVFALVISFIVQQEVKLAAGPRDQGMRVAGRRRPSLVLALLLLAAGVGLAVAWFWLLQ